MVSGVVICHGLLAFELVNAVRKILGHSDNLYPFSNDNLAPPVIYQNIVEIIKKKKNTPQIILMVDLRGGSCWTVAKMLTREYPQSKVISGVNISMLVSFLTKNGHLPFEELPKVLEDDAHRGITMD